ncbi:hypothetical protein GCM10029978_047120 [Actinoallomurus acanthiterrae]
MLGAAHALRGALATGNPDVRRLGHKLRATLDPRAYQAYDQGRRLGRDDALAAIADRLVC